MFDSQRSIAMFFGIVFAMAGENASTASGQDAEARHEQELLFESSVRPVLVQTCLACHNSGKRSGGLSLESRELILTGGESGPSMIPGRPDESLLLKAIAGHEGVSAMPPDEEKRLRPDQVSAFADWIRGGAIWPDKHRALTAETHWAFRRIERPQVPARDEWCQTEIDAFIRAAQEVHHVHALPTAAKRLLIRRASYGLTGLPPTTEDVDAFLADDSSDAWETVIDRLLASDAYGEHFGRHWLDVVRYADTAGENSDHPLPHAWRYRNWVIKAFNSNMPFSQMIREQIAGDLLHSEDAPEEYAAGVVATGYLAIARRFGHDIDADMHLTMEDTIDTLGKSFLGLSLGCARCHDHKFDPITAQDYYALYGVFESTRFSFPGCEPKQQPRDLVPLIPPAVFASEIAPIRSQVEKIEARLNALQAEIDALNAALGQAAANSPAVLTTGATPDGGSAAMFAAEGGQEISLRKGDALLLTIAPGGNHGADSTRIDWRISDAEHPERSWGPSDLLDNFGASNPHVSEEGSGVWCFLDAAGGLRLLPEFVNRINDRTELQAWRSGDTPSVFINRSNQPVSVWTTLPPRSFFVHPGASGPVAVAWISPIDVRVSMAGVVADAHPGVDGVEWTVSHIPAPDFSGTVSQLSGLMNEQRALMAERAALSEKLSVPVAYAVTEAMPHDTALHLRGDPLTPGEVVKRRVPATFGGQSLASENSSGRLELANWLGSADNPLTARVFVNRVWQWHFGRGLVVTPNDFGTRGVPPSHPELLDFLAADFMESGWDLKRLNRNIMLSAVYQQEATPASASESVWLAGFPRHRLSAEELRDSLLAVSGALDSSMGEAHPFPPESTWSFSQHAPFAAEYDTDRRSVYVMQKRNRRSRFFALFDGADPNASTATRDVTTVPTQALYFMNDPFVRQQAERLAGLAMSEGRTAQERVEWLTRQVFGRPATAEEQRDLSELTIGSSHDEEMSALVSFCHIMLSSNEFLYVD